jgi:hypothetical protein
LICDLNKRFPDNPITVETGADVVDCTFKPAIPNTTNPVAIGEGAWTPLEEAPLSIVAGEERFSVAFDANGSVMAVASSTTVQVFAFMDTWMPAGESIAIAQAKNGLVVARSSDGSVVGVATPGGGDTVGRLAVYRFDGTTWAQLGSDIEGDFGLSDFGRNIAISGVSATIATGVRTFRGDRGAIFVYEFGGESWTQKGVTIEGSAGSFLGSSIAMNDAGTVVAVGGPEKDNGFVVVFQFDDGTAAWAQLGSDIIPITPTAGAFGASVDLSTDGLSIAIGAPADEGGLNKAGLVRLMDFVGGNWIQVAPDLAEEQPLDHTEATVALSSDGRIITFGRPQASGGSGQVITMRWDSAEWIRIGGIVQPATANQTAQWGSSIAFSSSSNRLAVCDIGSNEVHTFEMR